MIFILPMYCSVDRFIDDMVGNPLYPRYDSIPYNAYCEILKLPSLSQGSRFFHNEALGQEPQHDLEQCSTGITD